VSFFSNPNYDVPDNAALKLFMTHPKFEEAMVFLNKLWREGLISKDYFTETHEQVKEKLANGRTAVYTSSNVITAIGFEALNALKAKDPTNDFIWKEPPAANDIKVEDVKYNSSSMLGNPMVVTTSAEKPERIVQLWDYLFSPEGSMIVYYGPPGTMYTEWDENYYPYVTKMYSDLTDEERNQLGIYRWWYPGNAVYGGQSTIAINDRLPEDKKGWDIEIQKNTCWPRAWDSTAYHMVFPDPKSEVGIKYISVQDAIAKALPKIITADSESQCIELLNQAIENVYSLGFEEVEKSMTDIWKENLAKIKG
jgi:putative aldouronate transport system substrate-binding protein